MSALLKHESGNLMSYGMREAWSNMVITSHMVQVATEHLK